MTTESPPLSPSFSSSTARAEAAARAFSAAFDREPTAARSQTLWRLCADLLAHHGPDALEREGARLADSLTAGELDEIKLLLANEGRLPDEGEEPGAEALAGRALLARRLVVALGYPVRERWSPRARKGLALGLLVAAALSVVGAALAQRAPKNLALKRAARISSAHADSTAEGLVDGVKNRYGIHTENENEPWAEIDLGETRTISGVGVWNRSDSPGAVADRALPLYVEVSTDGKQYQRVARRERPFLVWRVSFPAVSARYVRVRVQRKSYLHLNEVEVYP